MSVALYYFYIMYTLYWWIFFLHFSHSSHPLFSWFTLNNAMNMPHMFVKCMCVHTHHHRHHHHQMNTTLTCINTTIKHRQKKTGSSIIMRVYISNALVVLWRWWRCRDVVRNSLPFCSQSNIIIIPFLLSWFFIKQYKIY